MSDDKGLVRNLHEEMTQAWGKIEEELSSRGGSKSKGRLEKVSEPTWVSQSRQLPTTPEKSPPFLNAFSSQ